MNIFAFSTKLHKIIFNSYVIVYNKYLISSGNLHNTWINKFIDYSQCLARIFRSRSISLKYPTYTLLIYSIVHAEILNTKSFINFRAVHNQQVHLYYLIRRSALEAIFNVTYLLGSIGEQSGGTKLKCRMLRHC